MRFSKWFPCLVGAMNDIQPSTLLGHITCTECRDAAYCYSMFCGLCDCLLDTAMSPTNGWTELDAVLGKGHFSRCPCDAAFRQNSLTFCFISDFLEKIDAEVSCTHDLVRYVCVTRCPYWCQTGESLAGSHSFFIYQISLGTICSLCIFTLYGYTDINHAETTCSSPSMYVCQHVCVVHRALYEPV